MPSLRFRLIENLRNPKNLLFAPCGRAWYDYDSSKDIRIPYIYDAKTNTIMETNEMCDGDRYLEYYNEYLHGKDNG